MEKPQKTSALLQELQSLPLLKAAVDLYQSTKMSSALFQTGCTILEYSCTSVLGRLYSGGGVASKLDFLAGEGISILKEKYPSIQQSPNELRTATSYLVRSSVRKTMKTFPGQLVVKGMDWVIDGTEALLNKTSSRNRSPRKRKLTRSKSQKEAHLQPVSEDSGACDGDPSSMQEDKSQQIAPAAIEKLARADDSSLLTRAYKLGIVLPLDALVRMLRYIRWYMGGRRRVRIGERLTPEKRAEIEARRKISPRKRVHGTLLSNLKHKACRILGIKTSVLDRFDLQRLPLSTEYEDAERMSADRKRKHDEIVTSGSDTDEDYADFDFDNYESADDPDYEPSDLSESDSEDISDEDPESDIAEESLGGPHVQLKERRRSSKTDSPRTNGKVKVDKPVSREADSSVDPLAPGVGPGLVPSVEEFSLQPQWMKDKE